MKRPYRRVFSSAGDVRLALRAVRVAQSHLKSARHSHPCALPEAVRSELIYLSLCEGGLIRVAADLDRAEATRKRRRKGAA